MLSERVMLRYNEVRGRTEIHWLSEGLTIGADEQGLLTIFGGDGDTPLAALRGGQHRVAAVRTIRLRRHLQPGLRPLSAGLPLLVRQVRDRESA